MFLVICLLLETFNAFLVLIAFNIFFEDFFHGFDHTHDFMWLGRCHDEHFCDLVKCFLQDIVDMSKTYGEYLKNDMKDGQLFLIAKTGSMPRIWYKK